MSWIGDLLSVPLTYRGIFFSVSMNTIHVYAMIYYYWIESINDHPVFVPFIGAFCIASFLTPIYWIAGIFSFSALKYTSASRDKENPNFLLYSNREIYMYVYSIATSAVIIGATILSTPELFNIREMLIIITLRSASFVIGIILVCAIILAITWLRKNKINKKKISRKS